jgi:hypothetical protein
MRGGVINCHTAFPYHSLCLSDRGKVMPIIEIQ